MCGSTFNLAMRLLQNGTCIIQAASAAVFLSSASAFADVIPDRFCGAAPVSAEQQFRELSALPAAQRRGAQVVVRVDAEASPGMSFKGGAGGEFRYRMAFNNVAEGWSWQPQADAAVEDYYRWKFLPLQSVSEARKSYEQEEKIGERQKTDVVWRYDYFLAFDNPYDFYARVVDDDAGFSAPIGETAGPVTLLAAGSLVEPDLSESTTFWKAIYVRPVDFTLKKRYFIVRLEELLVCDTAAGRVLSRIRPLVAGGAQR